MRDMSEILDEIHRECGRQERKWGVQSHGPLKWLAILTEEVGEAAMDVNELTPVHLACDDARTESDVRAYLEIRLRAELIQIAAVATSWVECMDRPPVWDECKGCTRYRIGETGCGMHCISGDDGSCLNSSKVR